MRTFVTAAGSKFVTRAGRVSTLTLPARARLRSDAEGRQEREIVGLVQAVCTANAGAR